MKDDKSNHPVQISSFYKDKTAANVSKIGDDLNLATAGLLKFLSKI